MTWVNMIIAVLTVMWLGNSAVASRRVPSLPQLRIWANLCHDVGFYLARLPTSMPTGVDEIQNYLKEDFGYNKFGYVLPVSLKAGLPPSAAVVDTTTLVAEVDEILAHQCEEPSALLLDSDEWPESLPPPFVKAGPDYETVLDTGKEIGLLEDQSLSDLVHVGDDPLLTGVFDAPKGADEERFTSVMVNLNMLVDRKRIRKSRFLLLPMLAVVRAHKRAPILVSKRDVRHCFHMLRNGSKWRPYMAYPIPGYSSRRVLHSSTEFPTSRCWTMGFSNSVSIAQAVSDACICRAGIPPSQRLRMGDLPTLCFPVWGSIIDDFWILHQEHDAAGKTVGDEYVDAMDAV